MKKFLLLLSLSLFASLAVMAQPKPGSHPGFWKDVQEFKLKFLAQEMDLKNDQKEKFIELYNKMSEEKMKNFSEIRSLEKKLKSNKHATEEEYAKVSDAITKAKIKDGEIEKRYDEQFSTFLSQKQIFKMKSAEDKFREKMSQMRHKKTRHSSSNPKKK